MSFNTYSKSADFYDLDPRVIHSTDINFFVEMAKTVTGPVLELACGTGRITIPIAKAGVQIYGIDLSRPMLDGLSKKLETLSPETAGRVIVQNGDMTNFDLGKVFELIFIPFRSFQALTTLESQLQCLKCVYDHLSENGRFVLNVFRPIPKMDKSWESPPVIDWEVQDTKTGKMVTRKHWRKKIDVQNQILDIDMIFSVKDEGEFCDSLQLKYFFQKDIEDLLEKSNFQIVKKMGDYDGRPIGEGGELIYVCKK